MAYTTVGQAVEKLHGIFDRSDIDIEARKLQSKLQEAKYNPGDVRPYADCLLSILLAARSAGFSAEAVLDALDQVAGEMLNKRWKKMPDGTYQSI